VWNRWTSEVVGAYRLGPSEEILVRSGASGFYTSRLFEWKRALLDKIVPAIELGRSFVRPEYQKTFAS
jgi:Acetyltransferase (GNAT) domain